MLVFNILFLWPMRTVYHLILCLHPSGHCTSVFNTGDSGAINGDRSCSHMMTSSNGNIFRVTGPLCREFASPGEFPTQRPATRSFDVFFDLRLNKRLSKQPWGWWFETPLWSLWRHRNEHDKYEWIHPNTMTIEIRILLLWIGRSMKYIKLLNQHKWKTVHKMIHPWNTHNTETYKLLFVQP